jgi:hypothetical protein
VLCLGIWYLIRFVTESGFGFTSFPSLNGYDNYSVYLLPLARALLEEFDKKRRAIQEQRTIHA